MAAVALSLRPSSLPCCSAGPQHAGGGSKAARTSTRGRAPRAASEGGGGAPPSERCPLGEPVGRRKVCHLATSTIWDGEMLEEAAERELAHLQRTHTCMPGLGGHCGEGLQPRPATGEPEGPSPAGESDGSLADAPQYPGAFGSGGSGGGGGGAGLGPTVPGQPNSVVFVEGARWSGGAPAELPQEVPRRWRVRFSRAPSPVVGGPTLPSAASVGGEEGNGSGGSGQQQQQQRQPSPAAKRQRKLRQQLKAGAVSLPAPEPPIPPEAASEPPHSDAAAAARWQEAPPLAPPLGAAAGQGPSGGSAGDGIVYADTPSQELLVGSGRGGEGTQATEAEAEPAPQYRQPAEVLRLFSDDPPGARYSQPAAGALDITFRGSMPVLVAWLLAEKIVAPGQLAWSVLRGALPPAARRPLSILFWAAFAAAVLWPLH